MAHLRALTGADHDDPFLMELVEELSLHSEDFRRMWARHEVRTKTPGYIRVRHSEVGELDLWPEAYSINSAPGQLLVVQRAEPGSPSEHALAVLRDLAGAGG